MGLLGWSPRMKAAVRWVARGAPPVSELGFPVVPIVIYRFVDLQRT